MDWGGIIYGIKYTITLSLIIGGGPVDPPPPSSYSTACIIIHREIVTTYRLWDRIRVDHGKKWYLMLCINETLSHLRANTSKAPHTQTSSKKVMSNDVMPSVSYPLQ